MVVVTKKHHEEVVRVLQEWVENLNKRVKALEAQLTPSVPTENPDEGKKWDSYSMDDPKYWQDEDRDAIENQVAAALAELNNPTGIRTDD